MIVTYLTADNSLVSVCHVGIIPDGRAKWQVKVRGMGGAAEWGTGEFFAPPAWSNEQVARNALEWALGCNVPACDCNDPDCPGKNADGALIFGATAPSVVELTGPYFDEHEAEAAAAVQAGYLDADDLTEALDAKEPTIAELIAELDGKPIPKQQPEPKRPPNPYDGQTWKLG